MSGECKSGLLLAGVLSVLFVLGNLVSASPRTVSTFPWLVNLLVFPVILYPAIKWIGRRRHGAALTRRQGMVIGEGIVRWAALLFGGVALLYAYVYFDDLSLLLLVSFLMTVVVTWLAGVLCTAVCVMIIVKRRAHGG